MTISAKESVNGWTSQNGSLQGDRPEVEWAIGDERVYLDGSFTADELIEIAQHMKAHTK